jgi:hypothetical protein
MAWAENRAFPLGRVLTETDGPLTRSGSRPAEPSDVWQAVEGLASLHGLETIEVGRRISANLKALLDGVSHGHTLLVAAFQRMVVNNWSELNFKEVIAGQPR